MIDLEAEAKYIAAKDPLERALRGDDIYRDAFLGKHNTSPVTLSATLTDEQVEATLLILKKKKAELGWQMSDIHGISPALCMHNIHRGRVQGKCTTSVETKSFNEGCGQKISD